jgi:proline iminopeptidase
MLNSVCRYAVAALAATVLAACSKPATHDNAVSAYFNNSGRSDAWSGGARMIPIHTPKGNFNVWVKRVGNNPKLKVLLLHGGPAVPHDYLEAMDSFLPAAGIEYYYYDQLGAGNSDHPDDDSLWTLDRFVDEVEQVRTALGLTKDNFCLFGQSWGGMLAMEYALKHQAALKCLVISNMMASIPAYNAYAKSTLMPQLKPEDLAMVQKLEAEHKTDDPRYMGILIPQFYEKHFLRRPAAEWPEPVNRAFARQNEHIYTLMQGPSELGASGRLANWDRFGALKTITVPTLVIGARYDTMDPAYMEKMAKQLPHGQYAFMPNGSHLAMYDDQQNYFKALVGFLQKQE